MTTDSAGRVGEIPEENKKKGPVRRLYDWVLSWAETPYAVPALFMLALCESSFFPVPPDILLIALALSAPTRAFRFAIWCTLGSVIGGCLGYLIGWTIWGTLQPILIPNVFSQAKFDSVMDYYRDYDILAVFVAGFSPVPYKVFTVAAGVAKLNLPGFIAASFVGRGARFFLVALFIRRFGPKAKEIIDKYFNAVTLAFVVILVIAILTIKLL